MVIFFWIFGRETLLKLCYNAFMQNQIKIQFKQSTVENLELFSQMLKKDVNQILEEALEQYFDAEQKGLIEKNIENEDAMTNLDYDEFWGDFDFDD